MKSFYKAVLPGLLLASAAVAPTLAQVKNNGALVIIRNLDVVDLTGTGNTNGAGSSYTGQPGTIFHHHGNFTNNGSWNCNQSHTDVFHLPGATAGTQLMAGTTQPTYWNLTLLSVDTAFLNITNPKGVKVLGRFQSLNKSNTFLGLESCISTLRTQGVDGAFHVHGDSARVTSNLVIDGYMRVSSVEPFFQTNALPVGIGTRRRAIGYLASATPFLDDLAVAYLPGDPSATPDPTNGNALHPTASRASGVAGVSDSCQWDWVDISGTFSGREVWVSIPDMAAYSNTKDLRLVGWNGIEWVNLSTGTAPYFNNGPSYATTNTEGGVLHGQMQNGIQAIGIGTASTPLAVEFINTTATLESGCIVRVGWTVNPDPGTTRYDVERSADGRSWKSITSLSAGKSAFEWRDELPVKGVNYYRIAAREMSGEISYSKTLSATASCGQEAVRIYPNPAREHLTIAGIQAGHHIRIMDASGRIVLKRKAGSTAVSVSLEGLPAGLYSVQLFDSASLVHTKTITKQ